MRFYTALLVTAATFLVVAAPARAGILVGIGEQSPAMFSETSYTALDVHHARYVAPWDALHDPWETTKLDSYLHDARAEGTRVLLSFGRSNRHTRELPSAKKLAREFRRFRARYPWVTDYVTWNEANHCSQPTCRRPDRVAEYYVALKRACLSCRIVAADLLDDSRIGSWATAFLDVAGRDRKLIWGLHN
jgi:polysaccharide biosynthesis protein PslG